MAQNEINESFKLLGFKKMEDNVGGEVKEFDFYSRFANERHEIQFRSHNGKLEIFVLGYTTETYTDKVVTNLLLSIGEDLVLAIAKQIELIKETYKGELK